MSPKQYPIGRADDGPHWASQLLDGSDCERLAEYGDGGFCPILLGDILSGRNLLDENKQCSFKVIGKLGRGSYSTVWLGQNIDAGDFVAIKVLKQEHSTPDNSEMRILRRLGKLRVAFFHTHKPTQNKFLCFGLTPMGSSLRDREDAEIYAPQDLASAVTLAKTLVGKVADLHRQGICHGDISHGNVALATHSDAFTPESLKATFDDDRISKVRLFDADSLSRTPPPRPIHIPEYMIARDGPPLLTNVEDMSLVDILDYGKAFEGASKKDVGGTRFYSAPEVDREAANTTTQKSDLWSLGCVIAYSITGSHLFYFQRHRIDYPASNDEQQRSIISEQLECLETEPKFRDLIVRLIHSLVRIDPAARNLEEARRILRQLEKFETKK